MKHIALIFALLIIPAISFAAGNDIPCMLGTTGQTCTIDMSSKVPGAGAVTIWTTQATTEGPTGVYTANYAAGLEATKSYFVTCTCGATAWTYSYDITDTRSDVALSGIAASVTSAAIADAVLDEAIEGAYTFRQLIRLDTAILLGRVTGGGTTTLTFKDINNTKTRITATVDSKGNRSGVTVDGD